MANKNGENNYLSKHRKSLFQMNTYTDNEHLNNIAKGRRRSNDNKAILHSMLHMNNQSEFAEDESMRSGTKSKKSLDPTRTHSNNVLSVPGNYTPSPEKGLGIINNNKPKANRRVNSSQNMLEQSTERANNHKSIEDPTVSMATSKEMSSKVLASKYVRTNTDQTDPLNSEKQIPKIVFTATEDSKNYIGKSQDKFRPFGRPGNVNQQPSEDGLGIIPEESTIINTPNFVLSQARGKLILSKTGSDMAFNKAVRDHANMSPNKHLMKSQEDMSPLKPALLQSKAKSTREEIFEQLAKSGLPELSEEAHSESLSRQSKSSVGSHKQSARQMLQRVINKKLGKSGVQPIEIAKKLKLFPEKSMSTLSANSDIQVNPEQILEKLKGTHVEERKMSQKQLFGKFMDRAVKHHESMTPSSQDQLRWLGQSSQKTIPNRDKF